MLSNFARSDLWILVSKGGTFFGAGRGKGIGDGVREVRGVARGEVIRILII